LSCIGSEARRSSPSLLATIAGALATLAALPAVAAPPSVLSTDPPDQAVAVPLDAVVRVRIGGGGVDPATVVPAHVAVRTSLQGTLAATVSWDGSASEIVIDPDEDFLPGERVVFSLSEGVTSSGGEPLAGGHRFEFAAWSAPVPDGGFGTAPGSWPIGSIAFNVTVADLDDDGLPEAVFSNVVPDSLTILSPDGAGGFAPFAQLYAGILPRHTAIGDVDDDGRPDLVCCASGPDQVQVFRNLGGGSFAPMEIWATGQTPYGAALGDFDADGDLDIATANFNGHTISVLENDGNGSFDAFVDYPAGPGADSPRWVDAADLDGDGDVDLACCNGYSYDVSILLNQGDGTFVPPASLYPVDESPQFLELRDFTGDGIADVLTVNSIGESITLLRGNGDGTFQPGTHTAITGQFPYGLQVMDMDGDGDLDAAIPIRGLSGWRVMWNDGTGVFTMGELHLGGNHCHTLGTADWDRDGDIDVIAGYAISRDMYYYPQSPAPTVIATVPGSHATGVPVGTGIELTFNTGLAASSLVAEAFDVRGSQSGAHEVDLLWDAGAHRLALDPVKPFAPGEIVRVTVMGTGIVSSEAGVEAGGWALEFMTEGAPAIEFRMVSSVPLPGVDPVDVVAADLDADGLSDLVVVNFLSNDVTVLLTEDGFPSVASTVPVGAGPVAAWAGDLDGDGATDLAVANVISSSVSLLGNAGDGSFAAAGELSVVGSPFAVAGADFDHDGDEDLAVAEIDPDAVRIFWNDGSGAFPTQQVLAVGGSPLDLAVADYDLDGDPDLIAVDSANDRVVLLRKEETGFVVAGTQDTGNTPVAVFPWDTNGDGWVDLVSADYGSGGVSVIENLMDGTFSPAFSLAADNLPRGLWGGDLTGDGQLDLVTANSGGSDLSIFRNLGGGVFAPPSSQPVGSTPYEVVGGDWNGDDQVDLAIVNRTSGDLTLLLNGSPTGAPVEPLSRPAVGLTAAWPNPFRHDLDLELALGRRGPARIRIFDVQGRSVATVLDGALPAGRHTVRWDGRDGSGRSVSAGVYFARLDAEGRSWSRKVLRIR
jgi:hypothetical protein